MPWEHASPGEAAWGWVRQSRNISLGGLLEFACGCSPEQMIEAHGMERMESRRLRERVQAVCHAIGAQGDSIVSQDLAEQTRDQLVLPL